MQTFTIDSDNNITVLAEVPASIDRSTTFTTQKELAKLTGEWPMARLVDAWNSFAGVAPFHDLKPVKKFTSRKVAVARLWSAIERLAPMVTDRTRDAAPETRTPKNSARKAKRRDTARTRANKGPSVGREGSKKSEVVDLMRRPAGATLAEIRELTGWQAHTVRGFVSGTVVKQLGLKVESYRNGEKERTYRVKG